MSALRRASVDQVEAVARMATGKSKVQPIVERSLEERDLPYNLEAERLVLGSILQDNSAFTKTAGAMTPGDFSLEKHRRIFQRMGELFKRGEHINRVTLANELRKHSQLESVDGLGYLASLDDGLRVVGLESYVSIIRDKAVLRGVALAAQTLMHEALLETAAPAEILSGHAARIEALRASCCVVCGQIQRVEDLESVFAERASVTYLLKPELPQRAVVCLTGDSESGKTTLACAWAREVIAKGHAVLILDRDKNPRERICERFERLGVHSDGELLRIWDGEQEEEPPQPDHPIIIDWVKRMVAETGKSPLVIVDSLISFFGADEDENSATDMRALFNRCRALTKLGATVVIIHHTNRNGEARGSSDFGPASDQAFLVTNIDTDGGRLLDRITLRPEKSRYGLSETIRLRYAGGRMERDQPAPCKAVSEQLRELLETNPGILSKPFEDKAVEQGLGRKRARDFLKSGIASGTIRVEPDGLKRHHFWRGAEGARPDDSDPQGRLD
jgi:KaiC/GvpD/RAD55 family RecA-like ATPase